MIRTHILKLGIGSVLLPWPSTHTYKHTVHHIHPLSS